MNPALVLYLEEVDRGLKALSPWRRRRILRELGDHLLDEAEDRGLESPEDFARLLAEKEAPEALAKELAASDDEGASYRGWTAILAGALIGLASGGHLWLQGWRPPICIAFGLAHGLAMGAGFFWARHRWARLDPSVRMGLAITLATLLSIPLGFTSLRGFVPTRICYGAFTGYLLERHAQPQPLWEWALETLGFTTLIFFLEVWVLGRVAFRPADVPGELSFNLTLQLGVWAALKLQRALAARWVMAPGHSLS